ncbi:branched-chain amino acid ABC transporter permease [soil metagenome]
MREFLQLVVVGVSTGSAYALVGIGMVLIFRTTGIVNFAQGSFAVLGGLFMVELVDDMHGMLAGFVAVLVVGFIGSLVGFVAVGFRHRTTPLASLIITLGIALLIASLNLLAFGDRPHTYPTIFDRAWDIGGVLVQPQYVLVAGVTLLAALLLTLGLQRTIAGQALVACADSRRAAELVGIDVRAVAVVAFAVSAGLSALGWVLLTPVDPVNYDSDVRIAINGFAAAAFGGLASIRLAYLGGLVLGIAQQLVVGYADQIPGLGQQARQYELAAALVIMLVLIGWRARHEVHE